MAAGVEPHILDDPYLLTKEEITKRIESIDQSAASVILGSTEEFPSNKPCINFKEDIVGVVALIGTVPTNKLSRSAVQFI